MNTQMRTNINKTSTAYQNPTCHGCFQPIRFLTLGRLLGDRLVDFLGDGRTANDAGDVLKRSVKLRTKSLEIVI